ncbi:MAG: hypothetical protein J5529_04610 [Prevotella sp.]|nr:hypothetical protein [Prevotella sp.]
MKNHLIACLLLLLAIPSMANTPTYPSNGGQREEKTYYNKVSPSGTELSGVPATPTNLPGDANGDSKVDVSDVMTVVNKVLCLDVAVFIHSNADLNNDGVIDVIDVMETVYLVLHGDKGMGPGSVEDPDVDGN